MVNNHMSGRRSTAVVLLVVLALLAAACGGDDDEGVGTAADDTAADDTAEDTEAGGTDEDDAASEDDEGGDDFLAAAQERLDRWYEGTHRDPPTEAPKPEAGTNVWVISCGQAAEGCAVPANAAAEAGEEMGWDVTLFDGKLNPAEFSNGVNSAVAAGADAIVLNVVDCQLVSQALKEARSAGVKIYGLHSLDCDDPAVGEEPLFDAELTYGEEYPGYRDLVIGFGGTKADWIIVKTEGKAKTIQFNQDELLVVKYIGDGFEEAFKTCTTCEIVESVEFVLADLGPPLSQKTSQALLSNPDADSIVVPYDSAMTFGISSSIVESGRDEELFVMGGEGFPGNIQATRDKKGQDAGTGYGFDWEGWATMDGVNRLLQGEPQVDCGCGFAVWDIDHNMPPEGDAFTPPVDFRENYRKIWGLG